MKNGNCPPLWAQCLCYLYKKITVKRNCSERAAVNYFFYIWIKQLFSESSHCTAACCVTMKTSQLTVSLPHCSPAAAWPLTSLLATCRRKSSRLETEPAASPDLPVWGWRFRQKYHEDSDSGGGYWREEENTCTCFDEIYFHQQRALQRHRTFSCH